METVMKRKSESEKFSYPYSSLSDGEERVSFEILGQTPERSYEDRSVFLNIKSEQNLKDGNSVVCIPETEIAMWLNGEDAISLGMSFIKQGQFALEANMIQHQMIHMASQLDRFIREERVKLIVIELIDEAPVNYGPGFKEFKITPMFVDGKAPQYQEDFNFNEVIYWSPFEKKFKKQMQDRFFSLPFVFIGYDYADVVEKFNEECKTFMGECQ